MGKLSTSLFTANREMKSILSRSPYGIAISKLVNDNVRLSQLTEDAFYELMDYLVDTGTVTYFKRDNELHIVSNVHISQGLLEQPVAINPRTLEIIEEPTVEDSELSPNKRVPTYHGNREKAVQLDTTPFMDIIGQFAPNDRNVAIEVMTAILKRRVGCTISELTRHSELFNMLSEFGRNQLIDAVLRYNSDITWVDGDSVPTRSIGTEVLLHQNHATVRAMGISGSVEIEIESPFKAQLGKLTNLLTFNKPVAKPTLVATVKKTEHASAPVTKVVMVTEPVDNKARINELLSMMQGYTNTISTAESIIRTAQADLDSALQELKELMSNEQN